MGDADEVDLLEELPYIIIIIVLETRRKTTGNRRSVQMRIRYWVSRLRSKNVLDCHSRGQCKQCSRPCTSHLRRIPLNCGVVTIVGGEPCPLLKIYRVDKNYPPRPADTSERSIEEMSSKI